jgi:hypothetical protein
MGWAMRLIEKMTGTPHRRDMADSVAVAAAGVSHSLDELQANLQPYSQSDDPLVALMTDVFNKRQLKQH